MTENAAPDLRILGVTTARSEKPAGGSTVGVVAAVAGVVGVKVDAGLGNSVGVLVVAATVAVATGGDVCPDGLPLISRVAAPAARPLIEHAAKTIANSRLCAKRGAEC